MHKTPIGNRFIVSSLRCSLKPLAKDLTKILKHFQNTVRCFHRKSKFWSGINKFWIVSNNEGLLRKISKINSRNKARSISTFDFSTLYTKIPHDLLFEAMDKVIDIVYRNRTQQFVAVNSVSTWTSSSLSTSKRRAYSKGNVRAAIKYLIENCFFEVGGQTFRQVVGIPMGSDPAPFLANLFLYTYESDWLKNLEQTDTARARRFSNIFRYIDDLIAINDNGEFSNSFINIYPHQIELKQENTCETDATFLDIQLNI